MPRSATSASFIVVVIAITFSLLGCFPHRPGQAPAATATVAPDAAPTFSPDSFPDLDRVNRVGPRREDVPAKDQM